MRSRLIPLVLAAFSLLAEHGGRAATNVVTLGADFQAAINAASPGDTLVVQSGVYPQNLTFTKSLTILSSGTNGIQFTGDTTIQTPATAAFSQTQFFGTMQVETNSTAVLSQSSCSNTVTLTGGNLQAFDSLFQDLTATGGKLTFKRCNMAGGLNLTATAVEALRLTIAGKINDAAQPGSGTRFVLVQSSTSAIWLTGCQVYMGYSSMAGTPTGISADDGLAPLISLVDCDTVLVGNLASQHNPVVGIGAVTLDVVRGSIRAYNNRLEEDGNIRLYIVSLTGSMVAEFDNNTLDGVNSGDLGILVQNSAGPITLRANLLCGNGGIVEELLTPAVSQCSYCCVESGIIDGVAAVNCLTVAGQANHSYSPNLSPTNTWLSLATGSPCLNAGPPDAIYNNTDGTRNTIGYTGGPYWKPANYTNNNPVVFWLSTSNQTVLKGVQSTIPINAAAAAGH